MLLDDLSTYTTSYAFPPIAAVTDNTAQVSTTLDLKGVSSATLTIVTGTLSDADATFATVLYEGDSSDMSDETAVAAADLVSKSTTSANFTFADDNKTKALGYLGKKRYIRAKVTPTGNTGNLFLAGIWRVKPLNQPGSAS